MGCGQGIAGDWISLVAFWERMSRAIFATSSPERRRLWWL